MIRACLHSFVCGVCVCRVSSLVAQSSAGQGRRLGGSEPSETPSSAAATSAVDEAAERRARMAAAAEARLKQMGG